MTQSGVPKIFQFGPYVRAHRRHLLQQGEYTMCLQWELNQPWRFVSHEKVFAINQPGQDLLWKFNVPWSERVNPPRPSPARGFEQARSSSMRATRNDLRVTRANP